MIQQQTIQASEATIKTVSIDIQVVRLDKKQMTLAVFKQLKNEDIIDPDTGKLRGIPWGRVNYHVECESLGFHFHVIWQKGTELRRSTVTHPNGEEWNKLDNRAGDAAVAYLATLILNGWTPEQKNGKVPSLTSPCTIQIGEYQDTLYLDYKLKDAWYFKADGKIGISDKEIKSIIQRANFPLAIEEAEAKATPILKAREDFREIWRQSYNQLEQLDQLFIAV